MSKKKQISLPDYTLGEEITNAVTHGIGAALSVAAVVLCVVRAASVRDPWMVVSGAIYGAMMIIMYTFSTVYHALAPNKGKRVMRVLDHCGVFLAVAGSYTPYTLVSLRGPLGWTIFGIIWGATVAAIVFNAIDVDKFSIASAVINLVTGWGILAAAVPLSRVITGAGLALLIGGGLCYTVGAVLYVLGEKRRYFHSVFHIFVLAGSVMHFFSIFFYVIK